MSAIQLSFSLRTTASVKQVHLIGSWDGYQGQLPLSKESGSSKWRGTFRFQPTVMQPGARYWFYYMLDGYHVCHDPSKEFTQEPTTGRHLNILDVPASAAKSSKSSSSSRRRSREVPRGRPAAEIRAPKPVRPSQLAKQLEKQAHSAAKLEQLTARLAATRIAEYDSESEIEDDSSDEEDSDADSDVPSLSSSVSSGCSSPSSLSSSSSNCTCNRYGITRHGQRVKLDCGGSRCGDSESSEESEEEDAREYKHRVRQSRDGRRHGVVIR